MQADTPERVEALCAELWNWRDDAFVPHGTAKDGNAELQPIWLTDGDETPNGATVRFYVGGAVLGDVAGLERAIYMFDGRDDDAVQVARDQWKQVSNSGHDVTYWQQGEEGRWQKKA